MYSKTRSGVARARLTSTLIVTAAIAGMSLANAETVMSFNGESLDSNLVDAYISGRLQKPIEQATAQEREMLTNEVADVFLLSTLDMADENNPDDEYEALLDIPVEVTAVLGTSEMKVSQLLKMGRGAVVQLDRIVGEDIDIRANGNLIAKGEVVVVEDHLAVTMTKIFKAQVKRK